MSRDDRATTGRCIGDAQARASEQPNSRSVSLHSRCSLGWARAPGKRPWETSLGKRYNHIPLLAAPLSITCLSVLAPYQASKSSHNAHNLHYTPILQDHRNHTFPLPGALLPSALYLLPDPLLFTMSSENTNSANTTVTYSIGNNTDSAALSDLVKRYRPRPIKSTAIATLQGNDNDLAAEALTLKCIKVIVDNFAVIPTLVGVPAQHLRAICVRLPITLDPTIGALYVHDENYWKRSCMQSLPPSECQIQEHGCTWKQLFFENHLRERLETFTMDEEGAALEPFLESVKKFQVSKKYRRQTPLRRPPLYRHCAAAMSLSRRGHYETQPPILTQCLPQDYIFTLRFGQLPSHIDIDRVCSVLPNLTKLSLQYSINKIGMNFDRRLFGMKISDASCLAKSIKDSPNLTSVVLAGNLMDDDLLRMLMTGLYKSSTITHLDVSHNKITNHGVRLLAKLLGTKSVLTSLNIADNQVHAEGGRYLGRALRNNDSLTDLNMRLNRLTDEGGRMLLEGLRDNQSVTRLNMSSNCLGSEATAALSVVLREPENQLMILDLSSNQLSDVDAETLATTLGRNQNIISLDMRMNSTSADNESIDKINEMLHKNELEMRQD